MNYHHLYYFLIIAEENSVSRAAAKLRVGQPTLSAQLRQFEERLGVLLFQRQHKKLVLTEYGKVALDYARNIFRMGHEMLGVLQGRVKAGRPTLHLGALDSVSKQMVVQIVRHAQKVTPCQITLIEGRSDELFRELTAFRLDLVVTNHLPMGMGAKNVFPRSISKQNVGIYGAPRFKGLRKGFPGSLSGKPMILPTYDSKLRFDLEHWANLHQLEWNLVIESQDIAVKKLLAVNGMGLIPAASHTVRGQILRRELVEIGTIDGVFEEIFLISAERKVSNPIASTLQEQFSVVR